MRATRRQFLIAGGAVALAACSSSKTSTNSGSSAAPSGFSLVQRFPNSPLFVPGDVRLPISLAAAGGLLQKGPATLTGAVLDANDKVISEVSADIRATDIVIPYWAFRVAIAAPGVYTLRVKDDDGSGAAFQVFDPADVTVPVIGGTLQPFDTPTVADHRGVEPYCSLTPEPCPLHDITLTEALAGGKPVAYMIGTPAHCQTGTCAPALEFLVVAHERLGHAVDMVHADVYADDAATTLAPAVDALQLDYEPVVYMCAPGGTIVDRLDGIWEQSELDESLARIS